ncbi:histidinol-phosphatase HisJ [Paenibacillus sp. CC-CFT747]|nr:histidinol-phosphatase HisJ [Paenibacillus sp. CC-CFT747]
MDYVEGLKRSYAGKIEVTVGLELDYLPGRTDFADELIAPYADRLEDLLVSVHYLPGKGGMRCLDFTPADFREGILEYYGSMERVVEEYYDHVEQALEWAASLPGRKRLGHVQLIEKFRDALPPMDDSQMNERLTRIKPKLLASGMGLDVNTAGLRVGTCGKAYVPVWFLEDCLASGIECVYGSDAHKPEDAGAGWDWFEKAVGQR